MHQPLKSCTSVFETKWHLNIAVSAVGRDEGSFPLPHIDQLVDSTSGCELLSFLDAYSGYHQINMSKDDEEKTQP